MRIAFITSEYISEPNFDGGLSNYLGRVCAALRDLGHQPVVIVRAESEEHIVHNGIDVFRTFCRDSDSRVVQKFMPSLSLGLSWGLQSYVLNQKLASLHAKAPFSVVQYTSYQATALFRLKYIPAVARLSSFQQLLDLAYQQNSRGRVILRILERWAVRRTDALICPSNMIARTYEKTIARKVQVIEGPYLQSCTPCDTRIYDSQLADKKYALFFGTISRLKGIEVIASMLLPFFKAHPEYSFVFVGKIADNSFEQIKSIAPEYRTRIIHINTLQHAQLFPLIKGAQIVVLPSLVDNLPNTCIEAMAHGAVVIGTRGASFEQLIDDGVSGFLCEINNPESLLFATNRAISINESERLAIVRAAKLRIENLAPERSVDELLKVYKSVCRAQSAAC